MNEGQEDKKDDTGKEIACHQITLIERRSESELDDIESVSKTEESTVNNPSIRNTLFRPTGNILVPTSEKQQNQSQFKKDKIKLEKKCNISSCRVFRRSPDMMKSIASELIVGCTVSVVKGNAMEDSSGKNSKLFSPRSRTVSSDKYTRRRSKDSDLCVIQECREMDFIQ